MIKLLVAIVLREAYLNRYSVQITNKKIGEMVSERTTGTMEKILGNKFFFTELVESFQYNNHCRQY